MSNKYCELKTGFRQRLYTEDYRFGHAVRGVVRCPSESLHASGGRSSGRGWSLRNDAFCLRSLVERLGAFLMCDDQPPARIRPDTCRVCLLMIHEELLWAAARNPRATPGWISLAPADPSNHVVSGPALK